VTTAADALRWLVVFEGLFVLGTMVGLFVRVMRFAVPVFASRTLLLGSALLVATLVAGSYSRLGDPLNWRMPLTVLAMSTYLGALAQLYGWYRQPEGRKARHSMIASYLAVRMMKEAKEQASEINGARRAEADELDRERRDRADATDEERRTP
jgi:type VI protein secretion system component VasK